MSRISKYWVSPPSWIGPTRRPRVESRWCAFFRLSQKIVHTTDEGGSNFACSISDRAQSRIVGTLSWGNFKATSEATGLSHSAGTFSTLQSKVSIHHRLAASTLVYVSTNESVQKVRGIHDTAKTTRRP